MWNGFRLYFLSGYIECAVKTINLILIIFKMPKLHFFLSYVFISSQIWCTRLHLLSVSSVEQKWMFLSHTSCTVPLHSVAVCFYRHFHLSQSSTDFLAFGVMSVSPFLFHVCKKNGVLICPKVGQMRHFSLDKSGRLTIWNCYATIATADILLSACSFQVVP